jgi:hypothetical protein
MATALDLIQSALRRINSYQPGEQLATADANDCLETLNDLLDSWSTQKLHIYGTQESVLAWVNGKFQYKIGNPLCTDLGEPPFTGNLTSGSPTITGVTNIPSDLAVGATLTDVANVIPSGATVTAIGTNTVTMSANATATPSTGTDSITYSVPGDFAIQRPLRITGGFTRINELDFPFDVYTTQEEYTSILFKYQPGPWPTVGWYNSVMPYGLLNVYQAPGQAAECHLFTDTILANLTLSSVLQTPPGYARALKWNLALELWPEYWGTQDVPPIIKKNAHMSLDAVKALNAQPPRRSQYDRALIRGDKPDASWIVHGGFST